MQAEKGGWTFLFPQWKESEDAKLRKIFFNELLHVFILPFAPFQQKSVT